MDEALDRAVAALEREAKSWRSVDLKTIQELTNSTGGGNPDMPPQAVFREHYIETAGGQRFDRVVDHPDSPRERLTEYYCDGEKCADVAFAGGRESKQSSIEVKNSFKYEAQYANNVRPIPLRSIFYLNKIPLFRALRDAEPVGPAMLLGRSCDNFLIRRFAWGSATCDLVYTIDHETGIPLKLVGYNDATGYAARRPSWRWEALTVESIQGHLIPVKSVEVMYYPPPDAKTPAARDRSSEVALQTIHTVESIRFDGDYPKSTFWPVIAPEATVFDSLARKVIPSKVKPVVKPVANPVRVEPPRDWTPATTMGGVLLGAVLIGVGFWTRRRG